MRRLRFREPTSRQNPPSKAVDPLPKRRRWALMLLPIGVLLWGVGVLVVIGGYGWSDLMLRVRGEEYRGTVFSVRYPHTWYPVQGVDPAAVTFTTTRDLSRQIAGGAPVDRLERGEALVSFSMNEADKGIAPAVLVQLTTQTGQIQAPTSEIKIDAIGSHEAALTTYRSELSAGNTVEGIVIAVIVDGMPFIVQSHSADGELDSIEGMIKAMIRTLHVVDRPPSETEVDGEPSATPGVTLNAPTPILTPHPTLANGVPEDHSQPGDDPLETDIHDVIYENLRAAQNEDIAAYMATIHEDSPLYASTEMGMLSLFTTYDLAYTLESVTVVGQSEQEVKVEVVQTVRRLNGPEAFVDSRSTGLHTLRPSGAGDWPWKIYSSTTLDTDPLE